MADNLPHIKEEESTFSEESSPPNTVFFDLSTVKVKIEYDCPPEEENGTNFTGNEVRDIKVEVADTSPGDVTSSVNCASSGLLAETHVLVKQEDLDMHVEEEEEKKEEGVAQVNLDSYISSKDKKSAYCDDKVFVKTKINQTVDELGAMESSPLQAAVSSFVEPNVSTSSVLNVGNMQAQEEERKATQVGLDSGVSCGNNNDFSCDVKVLPSAEINQRADKSNEINSVSRKAAASLSFDSEACLTDVLLKEESVGTHAEEGEKNSTHSNLDSGVSFENKGVSCDKVSAKAQLNQRVTDLGGTKSTSQAAVVASTLRAEGIVTSVFLKEGYWSAQAKKGVENLTQVDSNSGISIEDKEDVCCGDIDPKTQTNQRAGGACGGDLVLKRRMNQRAEDRCRRGKDPKQVNQRAEESGTKSSSQATSVSSINSELSAEQDKSVTQSCTLSGKKRDLNSDISDKGGTCCGNKDPKTQMNQRAEESGTIESSSQATAVSSVNSELSSEQDQSPQSCASSSERRFRCSICAAAFQKRPYLRQHKKIHSNERPFSCAQCSSTFKCKNVLKRHLTITHSDERPLSCAHCSARFKNKVGLRAHLLIHSEDKPFGCSDCAAAFPTKNKLKKHSVIHLKDKPFACTHCSAKFVSTTHLKIHLISHSDERPFACPHCPSKFKSKYGLSIHSVIHSGERPYPCSECPARFRDRGTRRRHNLLVHSSERPFACSQCPAKFASNAHLKQHLAVHSNEAPFSCYLCSRKFKLVWNLNRHLLNPCRDPLAID